MKNSDRLAEIKQRLDTNAYFINPHADVDVAQDLRHLIDVIAEQDAKIAQLQKKNDVLAQHALELTQEMENIRSDFGNNR
jgi:hypothetical protein